MKKFVVLFLTVFSCATNTWAAPSQISSEETPLRTLKPRETVVSMGENDSIETEFLQSKEPFWHKICCRTQSLVPLIVVPATVAVCAGSVFALWWYGFFEEDETSTATTNDMLWKAFNGTYEEGFKLFCESQNVTYSGSTNPTVCDESLSFNVQALQETLRGHLCGQQKVSFDLVQHAKDVVAQKLGSNPLENVDDLMRKTLENMCEVGKKVGQCVLPEDKTALIENILSGDPTALPCGEESYSVNNPDDLINVFSAEEGCLTHSKGAAQYLTEIKKQSIDCARWVLKVFLKTPEKCKLTASDALSLAPGTRDSLCYEYVSQ